MATKKNSNVNGNLFEIKTIQSGAFRSLIEAVKEIVTEANIEFSSDGIKIINIDETHTVIVYLKLHADRFESYYCPMKYLLGVNMIYLFKLIKTMGNNDSLTLYLPESDQNKLGIRMENSEKSTITNYFLKLFDTELTDIKLPNITFTSIIQMPSVDLQKHCRDMNALGEKMEVEITSMGSDLIFRCVGEFAEQETIISENNSTMRIQKTSEANQHEIVQGVYELKYLIVFTKCTSLCPSIELCLRNDFPLILKYTVANLGEIRLLLAPMKNKNDV